MFSIKSEIGIFLMSVGKLNLYKFTDEKCIYHLHINVIMYLKCLIPKLNTLIHGIDQQFNHDTIYKVTVVRKMLKLNIITIKNFQYY